MSVWAQINEIYAFDFNLRYLHMFIRTTRAHTHTRTHAATALSTVVNCDWLQLFSFGFGFGFDLLCSQPHTLFGIRLLWSIHKLWAKNRIINLWTLQCVNKSFNGNDDAGYMALNRIEKLKLRTSVWIVFVSPFGCLNRWRLNKSKSERE